jgi:hypothetical protein
MNVGTQLRLPYTTWERARTTGATSATAGHWREISSASWGVRVSTLPAPKLIPPLSPATTSTGRRRLPSCTQTRAPSPLFSP